MKLIIGVLTELNFRRSPSGAGTEVNQEPGIGPDQGPRQKAPNTGEAENGVVRNAKDVKYGPAFSKVSSVMHVTIKPAQAPGAN
jgi:hypothetical protein